MRRVWIGFWLISLVVGLSSLGPSISNSSVAAQTADTVWRYALNPATGQLIAYNLDGETTTLLEIEGETIRPPRHLSFDHDHVLIAIETEATTTFYHVTPQSAEPIPLDPAYDWSVVTQTSRYAILRGGLDFPTGLPTLVYDSQTGQVNALQSFSRWPYQFSCCGFSADGQFLRYIAYPSPETDEWILVERILETGEERAFFVPDMEYDPAGQDYDNIFTDSVGAHWFWRHYDGGTETATISLVQSDGTVQVFDTFNREQLSEHNIGFYNGSLGQFPHPCEADCVMTIYPPDGDPFDLRIDNLNPSNTRQLTETEYLTRSYASFWVISTDNAPRYIGILPRTPSLDLVPQSPDGRWLTLVDSDRNPRLLFIWDATTQAPASVIPIPEEGLFVMSRISYSPYGQILSMVLNHQYTEIGFDYMTGNTITFPMPEIERHVHFEMLADGTALFDKYDLETRTHLGIWRYDPATDEISLVIEGNWQPIFFPLMPN